MTLPSKLVKPRTPAEQVAALFTRRYEQECPRHKGEPKSHYYLRGLQWIKTPAGERAFKESIRQVMFAGDVVPIGQ
jgi:hypothetical protein